MQHLQRLVLHQLELHQEPGPQALQSNPLDPTLVLAQVLQSQNDIIERMSDPKPPSSCSVPFPKWDGMEEAKEGFIEQLKTVQQDPWFAGATWTTKAAGFNTQSNWLRNGILGALTPDWLSNFSEQPQFVDDGFAMFSHLFDLLKPTTPEAVIQRVMDLADLAQQANESAPAYLARARRLYNLLKGVKLEELIPLLTLCRLDRDQFSGIHQSIRQGDKTLLASSISMAEVEAKVTNELALLDIACSWTYVVKNITK